MKMTTSQVEGIIFAATNATKFRETTGKLGPLTRDMAAAIYIYTIESPFYMHLNAMLRKNDRTHLKPFFPYLRLLLTGLRRLPKEERVVYRGVRLDLSDEYSVVGKQVVWWSLSSTTERFETLSDPQFLGTTGERTIFTIKTASARDISMFSAMSTEHELLLLPGTSFKIRGVLQDGNELTKVALEEETEAADLIDPGEDDYIEIQDPGSFYNLVGDGDELTNAMYALDMAMLAELGNEEEKQGGFDDLDGDDDGDSDGDGDGDGDGVDLNFMLACATADDTSALSLSRFKASVLTSDDGGGGGGFSSPADVFMHVKLYDIRKVASSGFEAFDPTLEVMRPMLFITDASTGEALQILPIEFLRRYALQKGGAGGAGAGATVVIQTGRRIPGGPLTQKYRMSGVNQDVVGAMLGLVESWKASTAPARQRTGSSSSTPMPLRISSTRASRAKSVIEGIDGGIGADVDADGEVCDGFGSDGEEFE